MERISSYAIIKAPSILGLFPSGVEQLPDALLTAGFGDRNSAAPGRTGEPASLRLEARPGDRAAQPDRTSRLPHFNSPAATGEVLDGGEIPIVLGGDCSILLGNLLALRRRGSHGLLFIDGHADLPTRGRTSWRGGFDGPRPRDGPWSTGARRP